MSLAAADPAAALPASASSPDSAGAAVPPPELRVRVEFSGGLELLFSRIKSRLLSFPCASAPVRLADGYSMRWLIEHLRSHHCTERAELFVAEDSVRPGILVLINDCDWELEDGLDYRLKDGDTIVFISTLHGGSARLWAPAMSGR